MKFIDWVLSHRSAVIALTITLAVMGVMSFRGMPINLFPDTNRPVVTVVTRWPGAASDDVATQVTHPIEVRLSGIDGVRRVTSTSRDQVSSVAVEFEYGISISAAATDVANEFPRMKQQLPASAADPMLFKITDAAHPVVVLAVTTRKDLGIPMSAVRRVAENALRDRLLAIDGVAEVEVFGGDRLQVSVDLDRDRLEAAGLSIEQVKDALLESNLSLPSGLVHTEGHRILLTARNLAQGPADLDKVLVPVPGNGHTEDFVHVGDLGSVTWGAEDGTSVFRGNGVNAVAVSLLRSEDGHADQILAAVDEALPGIRDTFPELDISIADTQGRLISLTVDNMLGALRDAVLMTVLVLLMFLSNTRAAVITALSLPLSYLLTFIALRALGLEFNMVTLTAIIIAVGLLADDAIVVVENIERRLRTLGESGLVAAVRGTKEILLADTAGTVSTVIVLIPVMFIGGYVQTVLRPLTLSLSAALFASLITSITIIPLIGAVILRPGSFDPLRPLYRLIEAVIMNPLRSFFSASLSWALQHRLLVVVGFLGIFVFSARMMPSIGRELMPVMDTGVIQVAYEASPDTDLAEMNDLAAHIEAAVDKSMPAAWLLSTSNVIGAEPSVKSFGAARTLQQGILTLNLIDRFHRDRGQADIQQEIRRRIHRLPGLISTSVSAFGATPLSSIRGTVDVMIVGPDPAILDHLADDVMARLRTVGGFSDLERSWNHGATRWDLQIREDQARSLGLTTAAISRQVRAQVGGLPAGDLRVPGRDPIPILARLQPDQRDGPAAMENLLLRTSEGNLLPLRRVATLGRRKVPSAETHQDLEATVDVIGYRRDIDVAHLQAAAEAALHGLTLPRGYRISQEGEAKQMGESFTRLGHSLLLGIGLLALMLILTFHSFLDPLAILGTLPLALIGASWAMMFADKHGCLPSFMGLILLMGIVVNNGILLVDFAKAKIAEGSDLNEALIAAVHLRTRPILITATASAVGMIPIAMEWAVGIERLSPLAVVAIGGLITGTFLTLIVVPVLFHLLESGRRRWTSAPQAESPHAE